MWKRGGPLLLALLAPLPAAGDEEPSERESEYEMPASEAWALPGFRVQLRFGRDSLVGGDGAPDASGWSFTVEPGIRLSASFSLSATLRYAALVEGFEGVRYTTSGDATWHPFDGFFLAAGIGYAGLVGNAALTGRCDGDGVVLLARTGWLIAAGELFATGPVIQLDQQWTGCGTEAWDWEEEEAIESSRTWSHRSLHFSWSLAWR